MINISKKKLPMPVVYIFMYLGYCAAGWFVMRGTLAYYGENNGWAAWLCNDVWAFFLGGLVPFLLYALFYWFVTRMLVTRTGGNVESLMYGLNYFVFAANLVLFGLKFMYLALPVQAIAIDALITPAVTLAFVGLYLWYAFYQNYVNKALYRIAVSQIFGTFATVYAIVALIDLILAIAAV